MKSPAKGSEGSSRRNGRLCTVLNGRHDDGHIAADCEREAVLVCAVRERFGNDVIVRLGTVHGVAILVEEDYATDEAASQAPMRAPLNTPTGDDLGRPQAIAILDHLVHGLALQQELRGVIELSSVANCGEKERETSTRHRTFCANDFLQLLAEQCGLDYVAQ